MGSDTKIQWTDRTFNPWIGCTKVSAGCTNCYAEAQDHRWGHHRWGKGAERQLTSKANWKLPLKWNAAAQAAGVRARVFCASLADVFDAEVPSHWRHELFVLIGRTPWLDWQLLTKRPENVPAMVQGLDTGWPNVWLGTSVEDQAAADKRIPALLKVPAAVHFLSCEPLLGPVDLTPWFGWTGRGSGLPAPLSGALEQLSDIAGISWVIVGGESGPKARVCDVRWVRSILQQCAAAGVKAFCKQLGGAAILDWGDDPKPGPELIARFADRKGGDPSEWPPDLRVRQVPGGARCLTHSTPTTRAAPELSPGRRATNRG